MIKYMGGMAGGRVVCPLASHRYGLAELSPNLGRIECNLSL